MLFALGNQLFYRVCDNQSPKLTERAINEFAAKWFIQKVKNRAIGCSYTTKQKIPTVSQQ